LELTEDLAGGLVLVLQFDFKSWLEITDFAVFTGKGFPVGWVKVVRVARPLAEP